MSVQSPSTQTSTSPVPTTAKRSAARGRAAVLALVAALLVVVGAVIPASHASAVVDDSRSSIACTSDHRVIAYGPEGRWSSVQNRHTLYLAFTLQVWNGDKWVAAHSSNYPTGRTGWIATAGTNEVGYLQPITNTASWINSRGVAIQWWAFKGVHPGHYYRVVTHIYDGADGRTRSMASTTDFSNPGARQWCRAR